MDTANIYVSVSPHPTKTTTSARGLSVPSSGYRAAVTVTWCCSREGTYHTALVTLCPGLVTIFTWSHYARGRGEVVSVTVTNRCLAQGIL